MNDRHNFLIRYSQILENEIKKYGLSKGWDMSSIHSRVVDGEIKVYPGEKRYLKFVDKGTKPFLMYALQGKVIPINGSFRYVTDVGLPGYTHFNHNGIPFKRWRDQKWRHPGIKPQNFVRDARRVAEDELQDAAHDLRLGHASGTALKTFLQAAKELGERR